MVLIDEGITMEAFEVHWLVVGTSIFLKTCPKFGGTLLKSRYHTFYHAFHYLANATNQSNGPVVIFSQVFLRIVLLRKGMRVTLLFSGRKSCFF